MSPDSASGGDGHTRTEPGTPPSAGSPSTLPAGSDAAAPASADTGHTTLPTGGASGTEPGAGGKLPSVPGYEVLEELGRGAMGIVYKARQPALGRLVALKMILSGPHASPELLDRFRQEARAVARLQHPNVVQVYEVGGHAGRPFLALELVEGESLHAKVRGNPRPPREAARTVEALARAIHAAHERGIVHRDLKPANVLLSGDGTPKITDFGLAKHLDDDSGQTRTGAVLGTPSYMAPEQAFGVLGKIGPRTDVYALGAVLYEMLTGRPPFRGCSIEATLEQVRRREPVPPSRRRRDVPRDLETVCLKCLQKEPEARYPSALVLAEDLRRFQEHRPVTARPIGRAGRLWRWARRNPVLAGTGAVALAAVLVGAAALGLHAQAKARLARLEQDDEAKRKAVGEAEEGRRESLRTTAAVYLERGQALGDERGAAAALPWLAAGLRLVPADAGGLGRRLRTELAARGRPLECRRLAHPGAVHAVAFSPDGRLALTGGADKTARLWAVQTGAAVGAPWPHPDAVWAVAFSPDGRTAATGSRGIAQRWNVATGKPVGPPLRESQVSGREAVGRKARKGGEPPFPPGPEAWVESVTFGPGGVVATGSANGAQLWDAAGRPKGPALGRGRRARTVAVSPDGKVVVVGGAGDGVRCWDAATGEALGPKLPAAEEVSAVAFAPGTGRFVAAAGLQTAQSWDAATGMPGGPPFKHGTGAIGFLGNMPGGTFGGGGVLGFGGGQFGQFGNLGGGNLGFGGGQFGIGGIGALGAVGALGALGGRQLGFGGGQFGNLGGGMGATGEATREAARKQAAADAVLAVAYGADSRTLWTATGSEARWWDAAGRTRGAPVTFPGTYPVVAIGPDGETFLLAGPRGAVLFAAAAGRGPLVEVTEYPRQGVGAAAATDDGRLVAFVGPAPQPAEGAARLWDPVAGKHLAGPLPHGGDVLAVALSPDGRVAVTACADRTTRRWDAATGKPLGSPTGHTAPVQALAFAPGGAAYATAQADGVGVVWDTATGRPRCYASGDEVMPGLAGMSALPVGRPTVAFVEGGDAVLTLRGTSSWLWDADTGETREENTPPVQNPFVATLLHPDGKTVVRDSQFYDLSTGEPTGKRLRTGQEDAAVSPLAFSPDGKLLLSCDTLGGECRLWDVDTGLSRASLGRGPGVLCGAFSPDGGRVAVGDSDGKVRVWDVKNAKPTGPALEHPGPVYAIAFGPGGKTILTGYGSRASGGAAELRLPAPGGGEGPARKLPATPGVLLLAPGGRSAVTADPVVVAAGVAGKASGAARLRLWSAAADKPVLEVPGGAGAAVAAFRRDGGAVLLPTDDGHALVLRDAATGRPLSGPLDAGAAPRAATLSADGRVAAAATTAGEVRCWDVVAGELLGGPLRLAGPAHLVALSPDGATLLTSVRTDQGGRAEGTTQFWETATGRPLGAFTQTVVSEAEFSPDGQYCLTLEGQGYPWMAVRLREVPSGRAVGPAFRHPGPVQGMAFAPDGRTFTTVALAADGLAVRRWRVPRPLEGDPERLALWAEVLAGAELDEGRALRALDDAALEARWRRLDELGGPP